MAQGRRTRRMGVTAGDVQVRDFPDGLEESLHLARLLLRRAQQDACSHVGTSMRTLDAKDQHATSPDRVQGPADRVDEACLRLPHLLDRVQGVHGHMMVLKPDRVVPMCHLPRLRAALFAKLKTQT